MGVDVSFIFKYEMYLARDQTNVDIGNFLPDGKSHSGNPARRSHRKCGFRQDWFIMTENIPQHTIP